MGWACPFCSKPFFEVGLNLSFCSAKKVAEVGSPTKWAWPTPPLNSKEDVFSMFGGKANCIRNDLVSQKNIEHH